MSKLRKPTSNFTMVPNTLLRDKSISLKAKGIYALLYSKPDGWTYIEANLIEESSDGRDSFRSGVKELAQEGWLTKEQVSDEQGRFSHNDFRIHETKQRTGNGFLPVDGSTVDGKPVDGKSAPTNTEITKQTEQDLVPPLGSPTKTKATTRESHGERLHDYLAKTPVTFLGHCQLPVNWEEWAHREFDWTSGKLADTAAKFCDYWRAVAGQRGRHLDWFATWRNWCRREAERGRSGGPRSNSAAERNTRNLIADAEAWASIRAGGDTGQSASSVGANQPVGAGGDAYNDGSDAVDVTGHVEHR